NSERMLGIVQEKLRIDNRTWSRIVRRLGKRGFIVNDPYHLCVPGAVIAENMLRRALQSLVPGVRFPLDLNDAATVIFRVSDLFPAELQLRVFNRFIQTDNDAFATLRTALFDYLVGTPSDWREFGDQCYDWRFTMRRVLASNPERTCAVLQRLAQTVPQEDEYFEWSGFREACDVVEDFCWTDDADLFRRAENLLREFGTVTDATRNTWKSLWNAYAAPTLATWDVRFEILQRLVRAGNEPATRALADAHAEPRWFTYSVRTVRIGNAAHYSSPRGKQTRDELLARLKQLENLAIDAIVENTPAAIDAVLQMLYRWAHSETLARLVDVPLSEADRTKALRRLGALLDEEELERWHIPAEIADEMRRWSEILRGQSPVENFIASLPQLQNAFSAEETRQRHEQAQQLAAHTLPTTIKRAVQRLLDDGGWDEISLLGTIAAAADPDSELFAWYVQQLTRDGKLQTTQGHRNILRGVLHRANQAGNPMLVLSNLALPIANGLGPHATIDEYTLAIDIVSAFPDELNAWERLLPILRTASTSRGRKIVSSFRFSEMMRSSNAQQRAEFFTALNEWAQAATEPENQTDLDRIATQPQPLWVLARAERALHALDLAGTLVYHFEKNDADKIAWNVLDEPVPRAMIRKLALDACYRLRREGYFKLNELADRLDDADFRLESASRLLQGNLFDIEAVNQVLQPIAASH
ncbi:MAG: hypothetical protein K8F32_04650, partial [Rhodocyclaceae bacterium]|nr:hypothetical protein [Rhodocyclaceae bacterium]